MTNKSPDVHPVDAWWTVLAIDPFAIRAVDAVENWRWVTPLRLTLTAHLLGVVTAVLFATGNLIAAAVVYEIRFGLDCMDGKLARRRAVTSSSGAFLDFVGDYVTTSVNFAALGLWLHWDHGYSVILAVAPAVLFLIHMCIRLSSEQQGEMRRIQDGISGRYKSFMARHRLVPIPGRVDVEHAHLFAVPIAAVVLDTAAIAAVSSGVVAVYFFYVAARFFRGGMALADARDRETKNIP